MSGPVYQGSFQTKSAPGTICETKADQERVRQVAGEMEQLNNAICFLEQQMSALTGRLNGVLPGMEIGACDGTCANPNLVPHAMAIRHLKNQVSNIAEGVRWVNENIEI